MNPVLPKPEGRISFSIFHPFSALRGLLGSQMYYKLILGFVVTAIGGFLVMLGPMVVSQIIADEVLEDEPKKEEKEGAPVEAYGQDLGPIESYSGSAPTIEQILEYLDN